MNYELSMLVPSIRPHNLKKLYDSVCNAFHHPFEFIVIGPFPLPDELKDVDNVKYIEDWGSPIRSQQRGLCESSGRFISFAADDGVFEKDSLNIAYDTLKDLDKMNVVMGKYREGDGNTDPMVKDEYYILNNHAGSVCQFMPDNCWMLNVGIIPRDLIMELGGWDSSKFQVCPYAYSDLSIRFQKYGVKYHIQQQLMFRCSHMPDHSGDHSPIHVKQLYFDEPMFKEIYNHPYYSKRMSIDINNWKLAEPRWKIRFGEEK